MSEENIVVKLSASVKFGDDIISEISFREPKGADLEASDKAEGASARALLLASRLSGLPVKIFRDMKARDAVRCMKVVNDFLAEPQETGETS